MQARPITCMESATYMLLVRAEVNEQGLLAGPREMRDKSCVRGWIRLWARQI
jgi:hypothetical protein